MQKELEHKVIVAIMDRAIEINKQCPEECRDFRIMDSPMREKTLLLRWTTINIDDVDKPVQHFRYQCFHLDGTPQNCSVNYSNQREANEFFWSLRTFYKQEYCIDHKN